MRKAIVLILILMSVVALTLRYGYKPLEKLLNIAPRAGLRIESNPKMSVFLNNKQLSETPYQDEGLTSGEYLVMLRQAQASSSAVPAWQGYVKLNGGTLSVINRDIAENPAASSGEIITLERGKGVTIISNPSGAEVLIDGVSRGRTPLVISDITSGEHQFLLSKDSFLKRTIRATLVEDFNLTLNVDLAISEAELTKLPTIPISSPPQIIISKTPTGFLRVRNAPSLSGQEIAQVKPGETYILVEEQADWYKIKLTDGREGYISAQFAEKKNQIDTQAPR